MSDSDLRLTCSTVTHRHSSNTSQHPHRALQIHSADKDSQIYLFVNNSFLWVWRSSLVARLPSTRYSVGPRFNSLWGESSLSNSDEEKRRAPPYNSAVPVLTHTKICTSQPRPPPPQKKLTFFAEQLRICLYPV